MKYLVAREATDHRTAYEREIDAFLAKIQKKLMPEKAKMVVAINTHTWEYVLGEDSREAARAFHERWPNGGFYMCRVDGTPSGRM